MAIYDDILSATVDGRYRIKGKLGAGAFGQVFEATHVTFGIPLRTVALKLFEKEYVTRKNAAEVFKEALMLEMLAADAHASGVETHLVSIYDIGVLKDYYQIPYVAMEFVNGGSLDWQLKKAGRFPLQTVIRHMMDICAGLELAHKAGIIHRDLKPPNILTTQSGFIKVADFGVAIARYEAFLQGGGGGTISYAPPESRSAAPATPTFDIYSLGVMMLEMLLGRNPLAEMVERAARENKQPDAELDHAAETMADLQDPITGQPFVKLITEVKQNGCFREVLAICLRVNPKARYASAAELAKALSQCKSESQITIGPIETGKAEVERLLQLAQRNLGRGEYTRAKELFEQVRSRDRYDHRAVFGLSQVYEKQNQLKEAVREQQAGLAIHRTRDGLERLAALLELAGQKSQADATRCLAETISSEK
jgi:serine/threonine protein kinase